MDMTAFAPRMYHRAYAWLGKYEWITTQPVGDKLQFSILPPAVDDCPQGLQPYVAAIIQQSGEADSRSCIGHYAISRVFAFGPKCFQPSLDQCRAMRHTDVNLPMSDYCQPYPQLLIEFPREFLRELADECGVSPGSMPLAVLLSRGAHSLEVIFTMKAGGGRILANVLPDHTVLDTIAKTLRRPPDPSVAAADAKVLNVLNRLAINFGILLMHYGCTTPAPSPDKAKLLRRKDERSQLLVLGEFSYVALQQEIEFGSSSYRYRPKGDPTGDEVGPHWRRGHWHTVLCGPGRTERKRVLFKPVFVRADRFLGDLADTRVTITIK